MKAFNKILRSLSPMWLTFVAYLILFYRGLGVNIEFWSVISHFLGGAATAWSFWLLACNFHSYFNLKIESSLIFSLFLVSITALVGVLWEFWEWSVDFYFSLGFLGDVNDTLFDLFMDLVGSIAFISYLACVDRLTILSK
ncbi:MAG: hypothetical protein ABEJ24_05070 [Candidatus Magasanikbacteria bacterium]